MAFRTFGKTKVDIKVRGCYDCGTEYSSGWFVLKQITLNLGGKQEEIDINICADCKEARESKPNKP